MKPAPVTIFVYAWPTGRDNVHVCFQLWIHGEPEAWLGERSAFSSDKLVPRASYRGELKRAIAQAQYLCGGVGREVASVVVSDFVEEAQGEARVSNDRIEP